MNTEFGPEFEREWRACEASYLAAREPWQQSGFSGPLERWIACRAPIGQAVTADGSFLDIGCANGYLLECLLTWAAEAGLTLDPFGLDRSGPLVELARQRLPKHAAHLFVGNAYTWQPPRRFDSVRTELCYVPEPLQEAYVLRLLSRYLADGGRLLACEYRSRRDPADPPWIDNRLRDFGLPVAAIHSGVWEGKELTRVAVVRKD